MARPVLKRRLLWLWSGRSPLGRSPTDGPRAASSGGSPMGGGWAASDRRPWVASSGRSPMGCSPGGWWAAASGR
eukprot:15174792-Alexandrium_andersonii.AAC.1